MLIPGDRIRCKVTGNRIIANSNQNYEFLKEFEILYVDNEDLDNFGYYVYVPEFYNLLFVTKITQSLLTSRKINPRFLNCYYTFIRDYHIFDIQFKNDGSICDHCKEWYQYAERKNNKFLCYACRDNPYR